MAGKDHSLMNVSSSLDLDEDIATCDEVAYAAARSINQFIFSHTNDSGVMNVDVKGEKFSCEILTHDVNILPGSVGRSNVISVNFEFRLLVVRFGGVAIEDFIELLLEHSTECMAKNLNINTDSIERGSYGIWWNGKLNETDGYKPNGNGWFRDPYQWTTNESQEVYQRTHVGNEDVETVIAEINDRKSEILYTDSIHHYDTAYNRHKDVNHGLLRSSQDGSFLSEIKRPQKNTGFFGFLARDNSSLF